MKAYRFRVPLTQPLKLKGQTHKIREGVLLERDGQWSEASPLPGFSTERIEDVISALRGERTTPPSLKFAIAALDEPVGTQLEIPWNYLLIGDRERVLAGVEECVRANCGAAKLKVGREDLRLEIDLVKEVRRCLPAEVQLRLDANQAWTFAEATEFLEAIGDIDLEYIEEPVSYTHLTLPTKA